MYLCLGSDRPDPQSRVAHGLSLIPVSVVVDEVKTRENAENSGTPRSEMVREWDDFGDTHGESLKHLEPMQVHWMNCAKCDTQRKNVRMRAYGEVSSVQ